MENNKKVCEGCECKCHGNMDMCGSCNNMCGGGGCWGGRCGGGRHVVLRWILAILIVVFVFCAGLKLGMMVAYLNGGGSYGSHIFQKKLMLRDGNDVYYRMGPGMMYGWDMSDNTQGPVNPAN